MLPAQPHIILLYTGLLTHPTSQGRLVLHKINEYRFLATELRYLKFSLETRDWDKLDFLAKLVKEKHLFKKHGFLATKFGARKNICSSPSMSLTKQVVNDIGAHDTKTT